MLTGVLISFAVPGLSVAEDGTPDREEVVETLTTAYGKLEGYIATYHFQAPTKTAEITLAVDVASGLGVLDLVGTKDGQRNEIRQWSTRDGTVYLYDGNSLKRMDAYMAGYRFFKEINRLAEGPDAKKGVNIFPMIVPYAIITKSSLNFGVNMGMRNDPTWKEWIEGAPLKEADGATATFSTVSQGDLTLSLESGLVVRQSTAEDGGAESQLEIKSVRLNPGAGAVAQLTANWKTDGAESVDGAMVASGRKKFFQVMIDWVEKGEIKLADLQVYLDDRQKMESFAEGCVVEKKGSLAESGKWEKVANDATLRRLWLNVVPAAEKDDDRAFTIYLADAGNRIKLRERALEEMLDGQELDILWSNLTIEVFGKGEMGDPKLKTTTVDGAAAKKAIEGSLGRAYFSAILDREITKYWERRQGIEE